MKIRTNPERNIGATMSLVVLLSACSAKGGSAECADVAEAQAYAESDWGEALQTHNTAHVEGHEHGAHDELIELRARVIITEAEVRRVCG